MTAAVPGPDSLGLHAAAARVPEQAEAAVLAAQDATLPDGQGIDSIVVTGEGTGAWSAAVVAAVAARTSPVPVVVARGALPAFTRVRTAVLHLGGGAIRVGSDVVPLGVDPGHERVAVGAAIAAALTVLSRMGLVEGIERDLDHAVAQLHHRRQSLFGAPSGIDAAKLARRIGRLLPLVYGEGTVGGLAARRWKQQCNLNAKAPAFARELGDVAHDEIAGWGQHGDLTRQVFCAVVLRHGHESTGHDTRFDALDAVLEESVAAVHHVTASGEGELAQLLDLAYVGDVVSLHLAFQEGLDPGPAPALDLLR